MPLFTPVGSYGDPLYDSADAFSDVNHLDTTQPGAGIISQIFIDPQCLTNGFLGTGFNELFDVRDDACQPTGPDFASPCAQHWYTGLDYLSDPRPTWPDYGFTGWRQSSRWQHSVVKDCAGVIREVISYVPATAPATPSPSPSPTHQCTSFSSACPDGPNNGSPSSATPSASVMPGSSTLQDAVDGF